MSAPFKTERVIYRAKNGTTGLTDVYGVIRFNGTEVSNNYPLTEINSTDAPGDYELVMDSSQIATFGGAGFYDFFITSPSQPAPGIISKWILSNNEDDLSAQIAALSTSLGSTTTTINTIQSELTDGTYGLSAIETIVSAIQSAVSSIQNNTMFSASMPADSVIPATGSNPFRVPMSVFNESGSPVDPDSQLITVSIANQSGTDRSSFLVSTTATRDSLGNYHVDYNIPSTEVEEELIFSFAYAVSAVNYIQRRVTETLTDVSASGYALQTTLLATQTTVNAIDAVVTNGTYGNAAIEALLANGTYGLSAIESILANGTYGLSALQSILTNGTYGLNALLTAINSRASQTSLNALQSDITNNVEGTGFSAGTDSLHQLSLRLYTGGLAV